MADESKEPAFRFLRTTVQWLESGRGRGIPNEDDCKTVRGAGSRSSGGIPEGQRLLSLCGRTALKSQIPSGEHSMARRSLFAPPGSAEFCYDFPIMFRRFALLSLLCL